jgi:hypothetical protein
MGSSSIALDRTVIPQLQDGAKKSGFSLPSIIVPQFRSPAIVWKSTLWQSPMWNNTIVKTAISFNESRWHISRTNFAPSGRRKKTTTKNWLNPDSTQKTKEIQ